MTSASQRWSTSVTTSRGPLASISLESLVAVHLDPAGPVGQLDRQRQLGAEGGRPAEIAPVGPASAPDGSRHQAASPGFEGDLDRPLDRPVQLVERQVRLLGRDLLGEDVAHGQDRGRGHVRAGRLRPGGQVIQDRGLHLEGEDAPARATWRSSPGRGCRRHRPSRPGRRGASGRAARPSPRAPGPGRSRPWARTGRRGGTFAVAPSTGAADVAITISPVLMPRPDAAARPDADQALARRAGAAPRPRSRCSGRPCRWSGRSPGRRW